MLRHYLDHHSVQVTQGTNPLVYAAFYRDVPCVQLLLDRGLDVNIEATVRIDRDILSLPPLIAAAYNQKYQEELLTLLLAWRCTVPRNAIHSFLRSNESGACKPFIIQTLLQHGADAVLLEARGENCLHSLLRDRDVDPEYSNDVFAIARMLVEAGCDPAALDKLGRSPIHLALSSGTFQLVEWLIENGFQLPPDAALHAVECGRIDLLPTLRVLFENGVIFDVQDDYGNNPLHILLRRSPLRTFDGEMEVAFKQLLDKGCDINSRNHNGETPLHLAVRCSTSRVVDFLIDKGAEL
ncbi:ankyrin repeat-containing domain protein, partial [Melanogaster broomeanus]